MDSEDQDLDGKTGAEGIATGEPRRLSRKAIAIIAVVGLLVAGGVWFGYDLSQRRTVPDLAGETLESAAAMVTDIDLELNPSVPPGVQKLKDSNTVVVGQVPKAGGTLRVGQSVSVTVEGRAAAVPDLAGLSIEEAEQKASAGEFILVHAYGDNRPPSAWLVSSQSAPGGKQLAAGSQIEIEFDVPEIVMPEVAGSDFETVRENLLGLGLTPVQAGEGSHVASADIAAGTMLEPFERVELALGYPVPDVVGKTVSEAKGLLASFTKIETVGHSSRSIVAQSVPGGSVVPRDTEITLTSPGPETVYRITGNGSSASVTWAAPGSFSIQQAINTPLPWEMRFPKDSGTAIFNAQLSDGDSITCQLERNGKVVKELTSTGPYAVVQC